MKLRNFLLIFPLIIGSPIIYFTTSCSIKPIEIIASTTKLYTDDQIIFSFQNVKVSDNITCTSEYDDKLGHFGYFHIDPYDKQLNAIILMRKEVQINETIECPITFWNNNQLLKTIQITLPPTENIDYTGFINDRTVSLMYINGQYSYTGTGWIINKDPTADYKYWLATNFHVISELPTSGATLQYGSTEDQEGEQISRTSNYTNFSSFSIEKNLYSNTTTVNANNVTGNPGNDMVVIDVNFGDNPSASVRQKLIKLNLEWTNSSVVSDKKHLNTFPDWNNYTKGGLYRWGGYPVTNCLGEYLNNNNNAEWHTDSFTEIENSSGGDSSKGYWHGIESTIRGPVVDVAPQCYSIENKKNSNMGGGASGSMLIDRDRNIVGIYWGGYKSTTYFYPYFDIFNKSDFSYLDTIDTFLQPYMYS